MIPSLALALALLLGTGALAAPLAPAAESCTREVLKAHTETLLAAQTAGKPDAIVALAGTDFLYAEDAKTVEGVTSVKSEIKVK